MKRLFDIIASLIGLTLTSPVVVAVALWIKKDSPGPVFYRGSRVGKDNRPFRIFKFRSMVVNADQIGGSSTSDRDPRITSSGAFVRKYKLDEIPQLINVLLGDMSLVGPRPEVQQYVDMYTAEEKEILDVRPGITDLASIWNSDEGSILARAEDPDRTYEELIRPTKLQLQLAYARDHGVLTDIKLILYTLYKLVNGDWVPAELAPYGDIRAKADEYFAAGGGKAEASDS